MKNNHHRGRRGSTVERVAALTVVLSTFLLFLFVAAERAVAMDLDPIVTLEIASGTPIETALLELADKANMLLSAGSLSGYKSPPVKGTFTVSRALELIIGPTGLSYKISGRTIYVAQSAQPGVKQAEGGDASGPPDQDRLAHPTKGKAAHRRKRSENAAEGERDMHQVTVEGHHILNSPLSFPKMVLTRGDFESGGFQTVGDVLRSLPQSFGGGLNVGVIGAGGSQNAVSQSAASTANLRGLGSDSTLVLVNGQRLATSEGSGAVDVTIIPISAVERIEITTGSASALYGSDAVAGVVNIILRTDFQGLELTSAWGAATEGGGSLQHYSIVAGHAGDDTNVFVAGDCGWEHEVDSQQRDYIPTDVAGTTLLPRMQHCSTLFSATRSLPRDLEASVLGAYTKRSAYQAENLSLLSSGIIASTQSDIDQYAINAALTLHFLETWTAAVSAGLSADDVNSPELLTQGGVLYQPGGDRLDNRLWSAQIVASGTLAETIAGSAQLAVGAGYNQQNFLFGNLPGGEFSVSRQRRNRFAFVESTIPLLAALTLDIAIRTEQYSDVGATTNPKVALVYKPNPSIKIEVSWGTSFRAPSLLQQFDIPQALLEFVPDSTQGSGYSAALLRFGGNPLLRPEKSSDDALDLTFTPEAVPGASVQIGYYDIFYRKRIEYPTLNTTDPLSDRNVWPFVTRDPSPAEIAQILAQSQVMDLTGGQITPKDVTLVIDDRNQNIARQKASGVDVLSKYGRDTAVGRLDTSLNLAYLVLEQKITDASPTVPLSGTVFYPPSWRGRFGVSWNYRRYLASVFVNYVGGSREVSSAGPLSAPAEAPVASWTTLDGQIGMTFNGGVHRGNTKLTLSAQNMFDRHPPLIGVGQPGPAGINYDSTKTSPLGRFLTLQLTQVW